MSTEALAARVLPAVGQVPSMRSVIAMEAIAEPAPKISLHHWDDLLALGSAARDDLPHRVAALTPDDTACIIYTSGTGGVPKGVLLSHRNIIGNCRGAYRLLEILGLDDEVFLPGVAAVGEPACGRQEAVPGRRFQGGSPFCP